MGWTTTAEAPNRFWAMTAEHDSLGANGAIQLSIGPLGKGRWFFADAVFTIDSAYRSADYLIATYIPSTSAYSVQLCSYALSGSVYFRLTDSIRGVPCLMFSNDIIRVSLATKSASHSILVKVQGWGVQG